jgi:hypothetical protein
MIKDDNLVTVLKSQPSTLGESQAIKETDSSDIQDKLVEELWQNIVFGNTVCVSSPVTEKNININSI